jgi:hypothetical protein
MCPHYVKHFEQDSGGGYDEAYCRQYLPRVEERGENQRGISQDQAGFEDLIGVAYAYRPGCRPFTRVSHPNSTVVLT